MKVACTVWVGGKDRGEIPESYLSTSLTFEKGFVVKYKEKFNFEKAIIEFYALIRDFNDKILAQDGKSVMVDKGTDTVASNGNAEEVTGDNGQERDTGVDALVINENSMEFVSGQSKAKLWESGTAQPAYFLNGKVYIKDMFGVIGKDIDLNTYANGLNKQGCISHWYEKDGVINATYNPEMKNSPLRLIRSDYKVDIYADLYFIGSYAKKYPPNTPMSYEELAYAGITRTWSDKTYNEQAGTQPDGSPVTYDDFGQNPSISVYYHFNKLNATDANIKPYISVSIEEVGQPITPSNILWNIGKKQSINLFTKFKPWFSKSIQTPTPNEFGNIAAHEFGHVLGLGDAYDGFTQSEPPITDEIKDDEVMRSRWSTVVVYPNTIEMVLEAFKLNTLQKYDPNNGPSKVIRLKPTYVSVILKYQNSNNIPIRPDTIMSIPDKSLCSILYYSTIGNTAGMLIKVILRNVTYDFATNDDWKFQRLNQNDIVIFIYQ